MGEVHGAGLESVVPICFLIVVQLVKMPSILTSNIKLQYISIILQDKSRKSNITKMQIHHQTITNDLQKDHNKII